jgi:hypothetical protein
VAEGGWITRFGVSCISSEMIGVRAVVERKGSGNRRRKAPRMRAEGILIQCGGDREEHTRVLNPFRGPMRGRSTDAGTRWQNGTRSNERPQPWSKRQAIRAFLLHSPCIFQKSRYFRRRNVLQAVTGEHVAWVAKTSCPS